MKRSIRALTLAAILSASSATSAFAADKQCVPIGGEALGQFYGEGKEVVAALLGTWAGARGTVKTQTKTATGFTLEMEHAFTSGDGGAVRTHDVADLTEVPGKQGTYMLELAYTVVESFGRLKAYAGTFNSFGLYKSSTGEVLVRYSGELCK